jgi:hypothetical protein
MPLQQRRPNGGPYYIQLQTSRTGGGYTKSSNKKIKQWPVSKGKIVLKYYINFKQFMNNIVLNKE